MSFDRCEQCGQPLGFGTLLDSTPEAPLTPFGARIPEGQWREFAVKYRCPACAEAVPVMPEQAA